MDRSIVRASIELDGTRNVILNALPKNITNGDVIRLLFPNVPVEEYRYFDGIIGGYSLIIGAGTIINIKADIWNAPYKKGED